MTLLVHIIIALTSIGYTTYVSFVPSQRKLHGVYLLTAATVITGTALGIERHMSLAHACVVGVLYLGFITINIVVARRKLAFTS
jgi:hypothetical protein